MNENYRSRKERLFSMSQKLKKPLFIMGFIVVLGLIGYGLILFGGKLVVNQEDLVLDTTTTIETADGKVISKLYNENRIPVSIDDIPEHVKNAFISIEDRRFYKHAGVDFKSVMRAIYRDIIAFQKVEGASTLTQQLAKNLFLTNDKTWTRKAKEVMAAVYLERQLPKERILELYLNQMYFGQGLYGVEAASQKFFSKSVKDLSIDEGALLAGLAKAPNGYSPIKYPEKALQRRNIVLQSMENTDILTTEERLHEQGKTLGLDIQEEETKPWVDSYTDLVMKEAAEEYKLSIDELKRGGYRIVVNLDDTIQQIAYNEFKNDDYFPGNTTDVEGAFVMLDQKSGEIIAAVGGRDYHLGELNRVTVKRQPGSTMKPIAVYGPALETGDYHPYSLIRDEKINYDGYTVANFNHQYEGAISIYESLKESKNASTVWLLDQIGINYSKSYLKKMQLDIPDKGLGIGLGGLSEGLSPLSMASSYRTFAHDGKYINAYTISEIYDKNNELIGEAEPSEKKVFSPQVSWNMTEILTSTVESGTASAGSYPKALAGKTGSTEHPFVEGENKDIWFVGYTPEYVSALWMGYDKSDKEHYLTGGSEYPTQLTKKILSEIDNNYSLEASFSKPENVEALQEPIDLPKVSNLHAEYTFGGFKLVKGKLTWSGSNDDRVIYRIYREKDGVNERVGEVEGKTEYEIKDLSFLQSNRYYVVPYDPLTKLEGERSESVEFSV
ncbi:transglycosylase domain-containing protein [Virgibacillus alimentarius]|uniref:Penicillin-binding protein 2A n=1 Tax=Virgibacillus alimentarius TaxID=698769 RepID=A0ABS4SCI4_9BACI|nr:MULTISPECIES: PBP1A family penicillin-binding protein [Virgibacillus]MBP2258826.1 penicillin-binding protein 2A [Virgibacillus alimentarius]HLR65775.1 PBP1A family penicillin-binding protein [Virgibacillus sp.]